MTEQRVVILDASHSLFPASEPLPKSSVGKSNGKDAARPPAKLTDQEGNTLGLQPIPGFDEIVLDAIREVTSTGTVGGIAAVDVGAVCDASAVRAMGRAIHDRVRARLND
jgi:mediator of RNA polymerase II transcription subunit 14